MTGAICGADPQNVSGLYGLSRPLRHGEVIDFFMSHSWHDNAEQRWEKLVAIAAEFLRDHARYPTYWLDKVCIDQRRIADGLKVLPVHVMACRQVLVLCGSTYPERLWCIWELCVLCSFAREQQALERIKLVPLKTEGNSPVWECLAQFDVDSARCYDPNEQTKLLRAIGSIGKDSFNAKIRGLGSAMKERFDDRSSQASISAGTNDCGVAVASEAIGALVLDEGDQEPNALQGPEEEEEEEEKKGEKEKDKEIDEESYVSI